MIESTFEKVTKYLMDVNLIFAPILEIPLLDENIEIIDLSKKNLLSQLIDLEDPEGFEEMIFRQIHQSGAKVGAGGYLEDRSIYNQSENFNGTERRTVHLGIDLWTSAGTVLYAPLEGIIHSFSNNLGFGNYGPTIILEHQTEYITFYTLYGHLSETSLDYISEGDIIKQGSLLGRIGNSDENGVWPPHLHFQIITDLENQKGDFPGVAAPSMVAKYSKLCPDPNLILRIKKLNKSKNQPSI